MLVANVVVAVFVVVVNGKKTRGLRILNCFTIELELIDVVTYVSSCFSTIVAPAVSHSPK